MRNMFQKIEESGYMHLNEFAPSEEKKTYAPLWIKSLLLKYKQKKKYHCHHWSCVLEKLTQYCLKLKLGLYDSIRFVILFFHSQNHDLFCRIIHCNLRVSCSEQYIIGIGLVSQIMLFMQNYAKELMLFPSPLI